VLLNASKVRDGVLFRVRALSETQSSDESGNSARRSLVDKMLGHRIATRLALNFYLSDLLNYQVDI